jgi:cation diffusion facilitator family transporter
MLRFQQRHSRAAIEKSSRGDNLRTLVIALAANGVITVAKLIAGIVSGSAAMLAEAAHSFADCLNEVFLGISLRRGLKPADASHPFGHGRERFLWAFMAAIASFLIGGCLSIALAIRQLQIGGKLHGAVYAWVVLLISFLADGTSWLQSMRQARREAKERGHGVWKHLRRASDPLVRAVVVEDSAALIGLALAACGLLLSRIVGSSIPDSLASLLIGVLLALTAFGLARPLADFLVGRSLAPEQVEELRAILDQSPAIDEIVSLQVVYIGPEEVIVGAKIHPSSTLTIDELTQAMDDVDHALRAASPVVADVFLDVTTYRADGSGSVGQSIGDQEQEAKHSVPRSS